MTNKGSDIGMPTLEFAFEIRAEVLSPIQVGRAPDGTRVHIPITGGTFEGPNIKGTVLPGADRLVVRNDGVRFVDAVYELETDDHTLITVRNSGPGKPEGLTKTTPRFIVPEGPHDWLNKSIFIGTVDAHVADGYVLIRIDCVV